MDPNRARHILRSWPFKAGQSGLKKLLSVFLPREISSIDIVPGLRLSIPSYTQHGRVFWWFEEIEAALQFYIARILPFGGRVIDVGAYSGLLGLLAARCKSAEVILIEANATSQACLEKTLALNPALQPLCSLVRAACTDSSDPRFPDQQTVRLDRLMQERGWDHVDLLKIDTDGHEYEVIRSLGGRLNAGCIDALFVEMSGAERQLFGLLQEGGFIAYGVRRTHLPDMRRWGRNEVERHWFCKVDGPIAGPSPFENFLWIAAGGSVQRHLGRWCDAFSVSRPRA